VSAHSGDPAISALALISPHGPPAGVCLLPCVCLPMHTSVCNTHSVMVN
jgi:hypothetical protein